MKRGGNERLWERSADDSFVLQFLLRAPGESRRRPGSESDLARLAPRVSREFLAQQRRRDLTEAVADVRRFAGRNRMQVLSADAARRHVSVRVPYDVAERVFTTTLQSVRQHDRYFHVPKRHWRIPPELTGGVQTVLGLDSRPGVRRGLRPLNSAPGVGGLMPSAIAGMYGLSAAGQGAGQSIAIIEPGGGYEQSDLAQSCADMGLPVPTVVDVSVGAGANAFGSNSAADREVSLDLQVAAAVAPRAKIVVYFCENSERGLADALMTAVHDRVHEPSVIVMTWGEAEVRWPGQARAAVDTALADAVRLGITVVAAAGDNLATDGMMDGSAHVDYPASSPYVLSCGGTSLTMNASGSGIDSEAVWNDRTRGTGGGISDVYGVPAYQRSTTMPVSVNGGRRGRGMPDIAAAASDSNGYRIVVGGSPVVAGGTSAVAPLVAGFVALVNEQRRRPVGFINPLIYRQPTLFRGITSGDNRPFGSQVGYDAGPGWNACAGLGSPLGAELARALIAD